MYSIKEYTAKIVIGHATHGRTTWQQNPTLRKHLFSNSCCFCTSGSSCFSVSRPTSILFSFKCHWFCPVWTLDFHNLTCMGPHVPRALVERKPSVRYFAFVNAQPRINSPGWRWSGSVACTQARCPRSASLTSPPPAPQRSSTAFPGKIFKLHR